MNTENTEQAGQGGQLSKAEDPSKTNRGAVDDKVGRKKDPTYGPDGDDEMKADKKDAMGKSDTDSVGEDELRKSVDLLDGVLKKTASSRKDELLLKAQGEKLSAEETAELIKALQPSEDEGSTTAEIVKSLSHDQDEEFQKAIDASDFLSTFHGDMVDALSTLSQRLEKSLSDRDEMDSALCKSLRDIGKVTLAQGQLIKSMRDQLSSWGRQPAQPPKSGGILHKGFAGQPGAQGGPDAEHRLSVGDVKAGLSQMIKSAVDAGQKEHADELLKASATYESTHQISEDLLNKVRALRSGN